MEKSKYSMIKPNSYNTNDPALRRIIKGKHQHKDQNYTLEKSRINPSTNLKVESCKNRTSTLTTKITISHNYFNFS